MPRSYERYSDHDAYYESDRRGRYSPSKEEVYDAYGPPHEPYYDEEYDSSKSTKIACAVILVLLILGGTAAGVLFGVVHIQDSWMDKKASPGNSPSATYTPALVGNLNATASTTSPLM